MAVAIIGEQQVFVPTIYCWENDAGGVMTAAFKWEGQFYGLSYELAENLVRRRMDKQHLIANVKATLDTLVHHGKRVLDSTGNINPRLVNDEEANRFWLDRLWRKKVAAFQRVVLVKDISADAAKKLGYL